MIYFHFFPPWFRIHMKKSGDADPQHCWKGKLSRTKTVPETKKKDREFPLSTVVCQKVPVRWYDWYDLLGSPVLVPDGLLGRRLCLTEENMQRHQTLLQVFNLNRYSSFNPLGSVVDPNSIWIQGVLKKKLREIFFSFKKYRYLHFLKTSRTICQVVN